MSDDKQADERSIAEIAWVDGHRIGIQAGRNQMKAEIIKALQKEFRPGWMVPVSDIINFIKEIF